MKQNNFKKFMEKFQQVVQKTNDEFAKKKVDLVLDICMTAVDAFYDSYSPKYYKRKGSLHNIYNINCIKKNGNPYISLEFKKEVFDGYKVDSEYIYDLVFVYGYHGGAISGIGHPDPVDSIPKVTEFIQFNQNSIHPYWRTGKNLCRWGKPAAKSASPYFEIKENIKNMNSKQELLSIFSKNVAKIFKG